MYPWICKINSLVWKGWTFFYIHCILPIVLYLDWKEWSEHSMLNFVPTWYLPTHPSSAAKTFFLTSSCLLHAELWSGYCVPVNVMMSGEKEWETRRNGEKMGGMALFDTWKQAQVVDDTLPLHASILSHQIIQNHAVCTISVFRSVKLYVLLPWVFIFFYFSMFFGI